MSANSIFSITWLSARHGLSDRSNNYSSTCFCDIDILYGCGSVCRQAHDIINGPNSACRQTLHSNNLSEYARTCVHLNVKDQDHSQDAKSPDHGPAQTYAQNKQTRVGWYQGRVSRLLWCQKRVIAIRSSAVRQCLISLSLSVAVNWLSFTCYTWQPSAHLLPELLHWYA